MKICRYGTEYVFKTSEDEDGEEIEIEDLLDDSTWSTETRQFFGPETRNIEFVGTVTDKTAGAIISQLYQLNMEDDSAPIFLHINSGGGSAFDGFAIYDAIKGIPNPVIGIVRGIAGSAALLFLQACDVRIGYKNSALFYHQPIALQIISSPEGLESESNLYREFMIRMDDAIRTRAKISKASWAKNFAGKTSKWIFATEAVNLGLLDGTLMNPKKTKFNIEDLDGN